MDAFEVDEVFARLDTSDHDYAELFRAASGKLSMTIAFWPAGGDDPQQPHTEDEVYYVASGRGRIRVGGDERSVRPGLDRLRGGGRRAQVPLDRRGSEGPRVLVARPGALHLVRPH